MANNKTIFNDVKTIPSLSCDSDHRMVMRKINFIQPKIIKGPMRKRFLTEKLTHPDTARQLAQEVEENLPEIEMQDIESEWNKFKETLKNASEEIPHCGVKKSKRPYTRKIKYSEYG